MRVLSVLVPVLVVGVAIVAGAAEQPKETLVIDATLKTLEGDPVSLAEYRGKAVLIVNTASKCGYTKQYAGLEKLYRQYRDRGLVVLGVPSPDFANQEFETAKEIRSFCDASFDVTFPLLERSHVKGEQKIPLYAALTEQTPEGIRGEIRWNFTKFLIDPQGRVVQRFEPAVEPLSPELVTAVEAVLPG